MALPADFHWGYATAALQIEGSTKADGRGPSVWDTFSHTPGKIKDGSNAEYACESYQRWNNDIALMKSYGVTAYRFSLSWSRIIPLGGRNDPINTQGVEWYARFIDALLENGITPFVTLFHWDLPQALYERYTGMLNTEEFTKDFERYARVCFEAFGDRVKYWITFNEPVVVAQLGHGTGAFAPGRTSNREISQHGDTSTEPWRCIHSQIIAHAHAARAFREIGKGGQVGITFNADWAEPYTSSPEDARAAERKLEFFVAVATDPIFGSGDYPESCKAQLDGRLPEFTPEEKALIKGSADFLGLNQLVPFCFSYQGGDKTMQVLIACSYTTNYIRQDPNEPSAEDYMGNVIQSFEGPDGKHLGVATGVSWMEMAPWGFRKILNWVYNRYKVPIYISENGVPTAGESEKSLPGVLDDEQRVEYFSGYLDAMRDAVVEDKVDIRSYFGWSLTDNWEWADGFSTRFGVTFVERDEQGKVLKYWPKKSASAVSGWFEQNIGR